MEPFILVIRWVLLLFCYLCCEEFYFRVVLCHLSRVPLLVNVNFSVFLFGLGSSTFSVSGSRFLFYIFLEIGVLDRILVLCSVFLFA